MGPCCCACPSCQPLTLVFKGGKELPACRCALAAASPMLPRDALALEPKQLGTLALQGDTPADDPAAWEVVLGMVRRDTFAIELVTWVSAWGATGNHCTSGTALQRARGWWFGGCWARAP